MEDFDGRTAVVTGAAGGIGLALATAFAELGMKVVLADRDGDAVRRVAGSLASSGAATVAVATDVTDPAAVDSLASAAGDAFGAVHVLANNAGILRPGSTYEQPLADWHALFDVNVFGVVHGLRSFVPGMLAHGEPCHVLNTASVGGLITPPYMAAYIASKHAVLAITECLAAEVAGTSMGVTALCPGGVATGIYRTEVERRATDGLVASEATERYFAAMAAPDRDDQAAPEQIAAAAVDAIRADRLHELAFNAGHRDGVRARFARIDAAMDAVVDAAP